MAPYQAFLADKVLRAAETLGDYNAVMTAPQSPTSAPESVFSEEFRKHAAYPTIRAGVNRSPYLIDLLTQAVEQGSEIMLNTIQPREVYFSPSDRHIYIGSALLPAVELESGRERDADYLNRFISLLGHEAGHAVLQDHSRIPQSPEQSRETGLSGEGIALATEYIVTRQLGGQMWAGDEIESQLDTIARTTDRVTDILSRRLDDPIDDWLIFDNAARAQGALHVASQRPSTARNLTYDEYYPEAWAVINTRNGHVLHREIDWDKVHSPDIEIVRDASGAFQVIGRNVPMDEGPHAGGRVNFEADFNTHSRAVGETRMSPLPASTHPLTAATEPQTHSAPHTPALHWAKQLLGPEVTTRLAPQRLDTICAAVVAHCAKLGAKSLPVQALLSTDGQKLGLLHEPRVLTEVNLEEAARKTVQEHLSEARAALETSAHEAAVERAHSR